MTDKTDRPQKIISFSRSGDNSNASAHSEFLGSVGPFENLASVITKKVWSPITWTDGVRKKSNFKSACLIALDFDSGEWTLKDAEEYCEKNNLRAIIGTTKSHQIAKGGKPPCDRFRVLIDADVTTSLDDFEYTMRKLCDTLPVDKACVDGARYFFPCKEIVYKKLDGEMAQWVSCPYEETQEAKHETYNQIHPSEMRNEEFIPMQILVWLKKGVPPGGTGLPNSSRHTTCYKIACYFARRGWNEEECFNFFQSYKSPLLTIGEKDVRDAIRNAYKRVAEDRPTNLVSGRFTDKNTASNSGTQPSS